MNYRGGVARGSHRPAQTSWISDIEQAKTLNDFPSSLPLTGITAVDFETLDSKIASGLKNIPSGSFREEFQQEEHEQQHPMFLTGRHIAWTKLEHLKIRDTHEAVLDLSDLLTVAIRNDIRNQ